MLQPRFHIDASGVAKMPVTAAASAPCAAAARSCAIHSFTRWSAASYLVGYPTVATGGRVVVGAALAGAMLVASPAHAQLNGENLLGDAGVKSGSQAEPGFYVASMYYRYNTDTIKDANGNNAILNLPASNLAQNAAIIINPLPPTTVQQLIVNNGAAQRSRITSIQLKLTTPAIAAQASRPDVISLTRTLGGPPINAAGDPDDLGVEPEASKARASASRKRARRKR